MKKILFCFIYFCIAPVNAQQSLQLDWNVTRGYNNPGFNMALSWYWSEGLNAYEGSRLRYFTTREIPFQSGRETIIQLDVVKCWYNPRKDRIAFFAEAGLSGMVLLEEVESCCWTLCDCLFPSEPSNSFIQPLVLFNKNEGVSGLEDYNILSLLPGITTSCGMEFSLTKRFYMGLMINLNAYYWITPKEVLLYLHSGISTGYRF